MRLTILTCTGGRPQSFALLERWIREQTIFQQHAEFEFPSSVEWIVVDDFPEPTPLTCPEFNQRQIRPADLWQPGQNTQVRNMRIGLEAAADAEAIFVCEDDDNYLPHYFQNVMTALVADKKLLVWGERPTKYYNVKHRRFRRLENQTYAILAATVIRREAIPVFLSALDYPNKKGIDHNFWYRVKQGELRNKCLLQRAGYDGYKAGVVGIKGMPGRPGIGTGFHEADKSKYWRKDPDLKILTKLVGPERAAIYAEFYEPKT